jgi:hypothetical protein
MAAWPISPLPAAASSSAMPDYQTENMDETTTILVYLVNELVDVWRPVQAVQIGPTSYRLLGPIPEDEEWRFQPGTIVEGKELMLDGWRRLCAVAQR